MKKIIYIIITFLCVFGFNYNVKASSLEDCTNNTYYVDYSNIYDEINNDSDLYNFYNDFKDWYDNQSTYIHYIFYKQGTGTTDQFKYRIFLLKNDMTFSYYHGTTNNFNWYNFYIDYDSSLAYEIGYFNFDSMVFDSTSLGTGYSYTANYRYNFQAGQLTNFGLSFGSFPMIDSDYNHRMYAWKFDSSSYKIKGSYVIIDSDLTFQITGGSGFVPIKIYDNYYCLGDNMPVAYSFLTDSPTPTPNNNEFWSKTTNTMIGLINITTSFYDSLWNENTGIGKFLCTIGLVNVAVSLCYVLFLRRHRV